MPDAQNQNLKQLAKLENLPFNWNSYGASPVPHSIIKRAAQLIKNEHLKNETPFIVPTGTSTIQLKFTKPDLNLDVDIREDHYEILVDAKAADGSMQELTLTHLEDVLEFIRPLLEGVLQ